MIASFPFLYFLLSCAILQSRLDVRLPRRTCVDLNLIKRSGAYHHIMDDEGMDSSVSQQCTPSKRCVVGTRRKRSHVANALEPQPRRWSNTLLAVVSEVLLLFAAGRRRCPRSAGAAVTRAPAQLSLLSDILQSSISILSRDIAWEHARHQPTARSAIGPTSPAANFLYSDAAKSIAQTFLMPDAASKDMLVKSFPTVDVPALENVGKVVSDIMWNTFRSSSNDNGTKTKGRQKRMREEPTDDPTDGIVCCMERFVRNAFRGPYVNQLQAQLHPTNGDVSEDESVVLLPNPKKDKRSSTFGDGLSCLSGAALEEWYANTFSDKGEELEMREAHAAQFLANGIASWIQATRSRKELESMGVALMLPAVSLRLASSMELVNFLTMAIVPTPSVRKLLRQAHDALLTDVKRGTTGQQSTEASGAPADASISSYLATSAVACGSLSAMGSQSRSLESVHRCMLESVIYGAAGRKPETFSRGELLLQASSRCNIAMESIVAALAEMRSGVGESGMVAGPHRIGAPAMPTRAAFDRMAPAERTALHQAILRHQFWSMDTTMAEADHHSSVERQFVLQRARHLVRIPLEALVVLVIATRTTDAYEQLLIRFWRIPFSPRTTRFELSQWVWSDEHVVLNVNLLSYVDAPARIVAIKAAKVKGKDADALLAMCSGDTEMTLSSVYASRGSLVDLALSLLRNRLRR